MLARSLWANVITETVMVRIRTTNESSPTVITGVTAFRRVTDDETAAILGGAASVSSVVFHLRSSTMSGAVMTPGCAIVDASNVVYMIPTDTPGAVKLEQWGDRQKCVCIRELG